MKYSISDMFNISGDVAIITGAAGGIGQELSVALGQLGVKVALVDVDEGNLKEVHSKCTKSGIESIFIKTDITNKSSVVKMTEKVLDQYEKIDILINTAGISYLEDAVSFNEQKWDQIINVNLKGTFLTCQAVGSQMISQKKGRIVNFSSVRGLQGRAKDMAYAPSKGAINLLTKSLAIEWAQDGVNVNAIAPTFTLTKLNESILEDKKTSDWVLSRIPKGKFLNKELIVGPTVFLSSPCSEFVTGQILYIDGGWTAS